jgi:hypothetical protein
MTWVTGFWHNPELQMTKTELQSSFCAFNSLVQFPEPYVLLQYPVNFSSQDGILFITITMQ